MSSDRPSYDAPGTQVPGASLVCVLAIDGRGELPYAALHGEPMHVHAWRALAEAAERLGCAGPTVLVDGRDADRVRTDLARHARAGDPRVVDAAGWTPAPAADLLLHDPLCPLTPAAFLVEVGEGRHGATAVGCRPVTDTVKTVSDDRIDLTVDRDALVAVAAPARVPADLHRGGAVPTGSPVGLLRWLRARGEVALPEAPSMARRVEDASALVVLESIDELAGRTTRR